MLLFHLYSHSQNNKTLFDLMLHSLETFLRITKVGFKLNLHIKGSYMKRYRKGAVIKPFSLKCEVSYGWNFNIKNR